MRRGFRGYPMATVAFYGPDNKRASKAVVGIFIAKGQPVAELRRWFYRGHRRAQRPGDHRGDGGLYYQS